MKAKLLQGFFLGDLFVEPLKGSVTGRDFSEHLSPDAVEVLAVTRGWLRYRLPRRYIRKGQKPVCIGQKQKWFLLRLLDDDSAVRLDANAAPEFDHWRWVSYWYPLNQVIAFKREVYRKAMKELALPLVRHTEKLDDR